MGDVKRANCLSRKPIETAVLPHLRLLLPIHGRKKAEATDVACGAQLAGGKVPKCRAERGGKGACHMKHPFKTSYHKHSMGLVYLPTWTVNILW